MVIEDAHTHTHTQGEARADGYTLTVEDVAAQIGKSVESVRRYIRTGRLPALRVEGKNTNEYRINPDDLHAIDAHTQSHTHTTARAGDCVPMGVSVETLAALAVVEQTQRALQEEIAGLRGTFERLAVALEENTRAQEKARTQTHDRVTAPPSHPVSSRSRVGHLLRWCAHQLD